MGCLLVQARCNHGMGRPDETPTVYYDKNYQKLENLETGCSTERETILTFDLSCSGDHSEKTGKSCLTVRANTSTTRGLIHRESPNKQKYYGK